MNRIAAIGTYVPPWGADEARVAGPDEDVVTMAVAAAMQLPGELRQSARSVVLVSRDLPLLEGGNSAPLLAGLGLPPQVKVIEQIGGGPAALDAVTEAARGTLVIGAALAPAAATALFVGDTGPEVDLVARVVRSLPVRSRGADGVRHDYDDPRLELMSGALASIEDLGLDAPASVIAGLTRKQAGRHAEPKAPVFPAPTASAALRALTVFDELGAGGVVLGIEQASATAVRVDGIPLVGRDEQPTQIVPTLKHTPGPEISVSLAAYDRAFEPKLRWEAGACDACGHLAMPPRLRCLRCGSEDGWSPAPLPRTGVVYTGVTIHVPVPGLATPYSLVIAELDGVDVRVLVRTTGVLAGRTSIGDRGSLVFRRVALRSGVPDYGYAFRPDDTRSDASARDGGDR